MNGADYLILAVLVISTLLGFFRGFMREAVSLIAWLGGIWLAWRFAPLVEPQLGGLVAEPPASTWAARGILLLGTVFVGWLVAGILAYFIRPGLSLMVDRLLGLFFGLVRGGVVLSVLVMLGGLAELDGVDWWRDSRLLPHVADLASWVQAFASAGLEYLDSSAADPGA